MKKQSKKQIKPLKPLIPNPGGNYFAFGTTGQPMQFAKLEAPAWNTQINGQGIGVPAQQSQSQLQPNTIGASQGGAGFDAYLGAAQGAMQLGSQVASNLDTSGIGKEVQQTTGMTRGDIMNTNVSVDANKSSVAGQSLSGAMTGAKAGMAFGPLGAAIGGGVGLLAGGISSIFGNNAKQRRADEMETRWINNLEAKDRQFNQQDLRTNMANYAASGGDLFAYGGQIPSQLTEFNAGQTHEQNPNGGVMQGTGANGKPNLVEEGETKHEDYIFSDRLKVDKQSILANGLPGIINNKTFADASKLLNKEAKERPNDPISTKAVKANLAKLTAAQEAVKAAKEAKENPQQQMQPDANMLAQGYTMGGNLYARGGKKTLFVMPKIPTDYRGRSMENELNRNLIISDEYNFPLTHNGGIGYFPSAQQTVEYPINQAPDTTYNILDMHGVPHSYNKKSNKFEFNATRQYFESLKSGNKKSNGGFVDQSHYTQTIPTGYQVYADGGNVYGGPFETPNASNYIQTQGVNDDFIMYRPNQMYPMAKQADAKQWSPVDNNGYFPQSIISQKDIPSVDTSRGVQGATTGGNTNSQRPNFLQRTGQSIGNLFDKTGESMKGQDYSRYAPVAANMALGINDIFSKSEQVTLPRYNPEMNTSRMDYKPIDTEWMNNKMNSTYAGTRDQMINNAGGNRATAMAALSGINQQQQNAIGEAYLKAQDMNYQRRNQADQFNFGIDQQNVAARNQAAQLNNQIAMQEMDMNAKNRAAKRNAARQAILQSANDLGGIGRENHFIEAAKNIYGYDENGRYVTVNGKKEYIKE